MLIKEWSDKMNKEKIRNDFRYIIMVMGVDELKGYIDFVEEQKSSLEKDLQTLESVCNNPKDEAILLIKSQIEDKQVLLDLANETLNKYNK